MARKKKNNGPHIYWRNGRAYADFRSYSDAGGDRWALAEPGATWGTTDPEVAEALFAAQLADLQDKRRGRAGAPQRRSTTLDVVARDDLTKRSLSTPVRHSWELIREQSPVS